MKKTKTFLLILMISLLTFCAVTPAGVVKPSGKKDYHDRQAILNELKKHRKATLVKGKTYYLNAALQIPSNCTLNATGATIISSKAAVRNLPQKANYNDLKNVTIIGGVWKSTVKGGYGTGFQFSHASGITMKNMTILNTCYMGHAIELVACKDVKVYKCKIIAQGKKPSSGKEEMIQIDVATPTTAPFLPSKLLNNAGCRNITIDKCTITGSRPVAANFSNGKGFHKNIVVKNCKLTGMTAEGLTLFNVIGAKVLNNTIIGKYNRIDTAESVGLHLDMIYGSSPWTAKAAYTISGNTIKGGRQAVEVYSHSSSKFGNVQISSNKLYCKAGKKRALWADPGSILKLKKKNNKTYAW